jgi:hypothetical protein
MHATEELSLFIYMSLQPPPWEHNPMTCYQVLILCANAVKQKWFCRWNFHWTICRLVHCTPIPNQDFISKVHFLPLWSKRTFKHLCCTHLIDDTNDRTFLSPRVERTASATPVTWRDNKFSRSTADSMAYHPTTTVKNDTKHHLSESPSSPPRYHCYCQPLLPAVILNFCFSRKPKGACLCFCERISAVDIQSSFMWVWHKLDTKQSLVSTPIPISWQKMI